MFLHGFLPSITTSRNAIEGYIPFIYFECLSPRAGGPDNAPFLRIELPRHLIENIMHNSNTDATVAVLAIIIKHIRIYLNAFFQPLVNGHYCISMCRLQMSDQPLRSVVQPLETIVGGVAAALCKQHGAQQRNLCIPGGFVAALKRLRWCICINTVLAVHLSHKITHSSSLAPSHGRHEHSA